MPSRDPVEHSPAQQEAVNKLSGKTNPITLWGQVREHLWGKGLESFQRREAVRRDDPNPVEDVELPHTHLIATLPEALYRLMGPSNRQILVRSEYYDAEREAVLSSESHVDAFVVAGIPGIGKSIFLMWLLMRRLALRLPTALQTTESYAILFHEGGVSPLTLDNTVFYTRLPYPSNRVWALVDLNPDLQEPANLFKHPTPFFVVGAISPRSGDLTWLTTINHSNFYMKSWTVSEVLQARPFLGTNPHTECQLWYLRNEFGASPRNLDLYGDVPAEYEALVRQEIADISPEQLRYVFLNPKSRRHSHYIITAEPSPTDRFIPVMNVVSRHVFELLWEKHIKHRAGDMAYFHDLFLASPVTAVTAGWLFELRMHQLLANQRTIRLFPILGCHDQVDLIYNDYTASEERKDPANVQLTASEERDLLEGAQLQKDRYYRPKITNFPAIDSLLLVHPPGEPSPILLMFQITRNKQDHDANVRGLDKVKNMGLPPDACRYYVVVTPEGVQPKIMVSMEYFGENIRQILPDEVFPVFHYPVREKEMFTD
ncbi:hypothetical protein BDM02DRAFT_3129593 [Thelephora ganbajun]|uniref:Uncharacterized protein n=1 Tax=Thelephora ganbajun TaxID=370292 RepID=A0ACB6ZE49_THEGA|nr:hypothetical protein BDM02DRAFT_3129593 [Thelephora ganbajun]